MRVDVDREVRVLLADSANKPSPNVSTSRLSGEKMLTLLQLEASANQPYL